ncbi:restriction endonuclease subunit S [Dyadobacter sp. 3J3]|uniref:restriction endonuclease subunit S n=1 Tax=Dyadobacter sp. 3J3 TaxID=2606600 RepID=UPI00135B3BAD|nr:restriction endonuclease subunit S [Dyadobacter sp. 3J3]
MSDWKETELNTIGNVVSGGTPSTSVAGFWNGEILFVTPFDLSKAKSAFIENSARKISKEGLLNSSANLLPAGSIIISSRAPIGYIAIAKKEFTTNQGCKSIIPNSNFDSLYLYYCISFYIERIKRLGAGSTFAEISKGDLELVKFPYPVQKREQKCISQILSTADSLISKTQAAISKYKAIKQGMLQDLFTRGIDIKTGKLRPKYEDAPELYKESKLGMVPKEWEVGPLSKISEINPLASLSSKLSTNDEVSFFKMEDVSNDAEIINNNTKKIREVVKKGFTSFTENDILFAKITPCMENGKGALAVNLKNMFGFGSTEFHVLRAIDRKSIHFLFFLTTSVEFRLKAEGKMSGSAGQQRVPTSFFSEYEIGLPSTNEQFQIGLRLNTLNKKIINEQTYLQKLNQLKSGLMSDLLSGKKLVNVEESILSETEN